MNEDLDKQERRQDDAWLDMLAGRPRSDADARTRREAEALRQAVLTEHQRATPKLSEADLARGRERLLKRLARERLLEKTAEPWWQKLPAWLGREQRAAKPWWWRSLPVVAGTLAGIAVLIPLLKEIQQTGTERVVKPSGIEKGFELKMPEVVYTEQPGTAARKLADSLKDLGLQASLVQQEQSWFINVQIPQPPPAELKSVLDQYQLSLPADGRLLVEFVAKE